MVQWNAGLSGSAIPIRAHEYNRNLEEARRTTRRTVVGKETTNHQLVPLPVSAPGASRARGRGGAETCCATRRTQCAGRPTAPGRTTRRSRRPMSAMLKLGISRAPATTADTHGSRSRHLWGRVCMHLSPGAATTAAAVANRRRSSAGTGAHAACPSPRAASSRRPDDHYRGPWRTGEDGMTSPLLGTWHPYSARGDGRDRAGGGDAAPAKAVWWGEGERRRHRGPCGGRTSREAETGGTRKTLHKVTAKPSLT